MKPRQDKELTYLAGDEILGLGVTSRVHVTHPVALFLIIGVDEEGDFVVSVYLRGEKEGGLDSLELQ